MPDLKNKYSDPELNPANKDFDEIVNRPDMQALNDQGDAIARDLKNSESDTKAPENFSEGDGKDAARRAEAKEWNAPENRFNYQKPDSNDKGTSNWTRRRKILVGAGAGGGVGLILSLFALLPLKIPGIMQMIADEAGQRVEQITERRAKIILGRAIISRFGANTGIVVTGNGAVSTLIASMRTNSFEKKLAAKGLTIEKSGNGVRLRMNGELIGDGKTLRTDVEVYRAMENNRLTRKMVNQIVKEEIPSWRWMKRAKFAKWLRIKYGVPRYGITNSDNSDPEERVGEMQEERLRTEYDALSGDIGEAVECVMTVDCDVDTGDESRPADLHESGDASAVADSVDGTVEEVVAANTGTPGQGTQKTLIKTVLDKLGTKAIPIVGWIDLVATIDHIAHAAIEDDYLGKLAAYYRAKEYARHYGTWEGYSSQIQLGAMDPYFIEVLAKQTEGVEEAQAFNYIQGDASKGVPVDKIGANDRSAYAERLEQLRRVVQPQSNIPGFTQSTHFVLNLYYETLGGGGLLGWASEHIGGFLAKITSALTPSAFEEWFGKLMVKIGGVLFKILGLDFDPLVSGPEWFNDTHGGATWTYNDFCQNEMGCRKLDAQQASLQNATIAAERSEYTSQKGLAYALFSTESSKSLISQLAIHTPSSTASFLPSLGRIVTNTPATLLGITTHKTSAAGYVDIHGVDPYGATDEELNKPVDPRAISGDACDDTFDGKSLDLCQTDTMVAEAMLCEFEPDSEECSEDIAGKTSTGEGMEFTVASYNILHSESHPNASITTGGCNTNPVPGDPVCTKTRTARQVKIITGELGNPAFDILGTQETSAEQYQLLKDSLTNYDAYPENASRMTNFEDGAVAIFWNKDKFSRTGQGTAPGLSNTTKPITNPWVELQSTAGPKVYVMSIHYATGTFGGTADSIKRSSELTMDWVRSKATDDNIVIVVGDFNDRLGQRLSYCVYTKDSLMQHAVDMAAGASPDKGCTANRFNGIDHIYATPKLGLEANDWQHMAKTGEVATASDHSPVYVTYKIPGESTGSTLNIATFNILHTGGADGTDFEKDWRNRMPKSISTLKDNGIAVAGLQEVRPEQHKLLTSESYATNTYDIFPKTATGSGYSPNPVIWNKSSYKLVTGKTLPIEYDNGNKIDHAVLVQLEDMSGNQFYVLNTHDPANARPGTDAQNALSRLHNAEYYTQYLGDLAKQGKPIFLTGDFNSAYTMSGNQQPYNNLASNLTYCVVSRGGILKNVWDIFEKKKFTCPRDKTPDGAPIDHIYTANTNGVSKAWTAESKTNGSDHPTVMASVAMPGAAGATANGAWAWPVTASAWKTDGHRWLEPHTAISDAWTNNLKAAADVNIGSQNEDCGKPVYSMLSGTIVSNPPTYTMQVKSKINGKDVLLTYAHGNNMKKTGTVRAGQQIMTIGNNSRYGGTCHLHLEILYGNKPICPQDVFPLMAAKQQVDLGALREARYVCG